MKNRYARLFAAKKQLGLDEDAFYDAVERVAETRSLRALNDDQVKELEDRFKRDGAQFGRGSSKRASGPYAKKLQALWIAAWNLGIVRSRDDAAMIAFVKRQTGLDHTRFLQDIGDADKAIEALKSWMTREAGVDWSLSPSQEDWYRNPQCRIALAQLHRLNNTGARCRARDLAGKELPLMADLAGYGERMVGGHITRWKWSEWITIMNALGVELRAALSQERKAS